MSDHDSTVLKRAVRHAYEDLKIELQQASDEHRRAVRTAYTALATGRLRYPSSDSPMVAVNCLFRYVHMCAEAVKRFRREYPDAVSGERIAPHAVGVFNSLTLDHGAAQAGLQLHNILLAGCAVRDLPTPLPGHPDPRPMGQRVVRLFCPSDADVCIDGEILELAKELEFDTLMEVAKAEGKFAEASVAKSRERDRPEWFPRKASTSKPDASAAGGTAGGQQNEKVERLNTRSKEGRDAVDRILRDLLSQQPDLIDRKRQLWKAVSCRPEMEGVSYSFVMKRPPVQEALSKAADRFRRRQQLQIPQDRLDQFADQEFSEEKLEMLLEEFSPADTCSRKPVRRNV